MSTKPKKPQIAPEIGQADDLPINKSLAQVILEQVDLVGPGKALSAHSLAKAFRPPEPSEEPGQENWRRFVRQVRFEAIGLARKGQVDIVRKGKVLDPNVPFKGLYKIRAKQSD